MKAPLPPDTPMPPPLPPTPDQVIIRKDYDPKGNTVRYVSKFLLCTMCLFFVF